MKIIAPWACLLALSGTVMAQSAGSKPLYDYRVGHFDKAYEALASETNASGMVEYYLARMQLYGYGAPKNPEAMRHFQQAMQKGSIAAAWWLGRYYLNHNNAKSAFDAFKKVADSGDDAAKMYVIAALLHGYGVGKNPDAARRYIIDCARKGNAQAQYTLASQFLDSRDMRNRRLGLIWLEKAAKQQYAPAVYLQSRVYEEGKTGTKNPELAKTLLQQAAILGYFPAVELVWQQAMDKKDTPAALQVLNNAKTDNLPGLWYLKGKILVDTKASKTEVDEGMALLKKSADGGYARAAAMLAEHYKAELAATKTDNMPLQEMQAYWQKKADTLAKEEQAPDLRGQMLAWLSSGQAESFEQTPYALSGISVDWFNPEAKEYGQMNPVPVMPHIARKDIFTPTFHYIKPQEVPISNYFDVLAPLFAVEHHRSDLDIPHYPIVQAVQSLENAKSPVLKHNHWQSVVDNGHFVPTATDSEAYSALDRYTTNWERQANYQQVLSDLYGRSILGDADAQFALGQLYHYGIVVAKNQEQAVTYYELAAIQQDVRAEYNLGIFFLSHTDKPDDLRKALTWLNDAAFKGNSYAQYVLAQLYDRGLSANDGTEILARNHNQAMAMYYLASANHMGKAQAALAENLAMENNAALSVTARQQRISLVTRLYEGAVKNGVSEAYLPLAFYLAMEQDKVRQQWAFSTAQQYANQGNPLAGLLLGLLYDRGIAVAANPSQARYWLDKSSDNPVSAFILGTYALLGTNESVDAQDGQKLLEQAANQKLPYAMFNLAILKQKQQQDPLPMLQQARASGSAPAGLLIADIFLARANNPEQMQEAKAIYTQLAEKGDRQAQLKLGFLNDRGLGGPVDYAKAKYWYEQAAQQNDPRAQFLLGQAYQLGKLGSEPDYKEAMRWYQKAEKALPIAAVAAGFVQDVFLDNYDAARQHYALANQGGDMLASYNQGLIFSLGKGVAMNWNKAEASFNIAAQRGFVPAMLGLGRYYLAHQPTQPEQAWDWYKKASDKGSAEATYQLGLMMEAGLGTRLNYRDALEKYQKACDKAFQKACVAAARMTQYGIGVNQDTAYAVARYQGLAAQDNSFAQYQLAKMAIQGQVPSVSADDITRLLERAKLGGYQPAVILLQWYQAKINQNQSFVPAWRVASIATPSFTRSNADSMYVEALDNWNRGDEQASRQMLRALVKQYPDYLPARKALERLGWSADDIVG